MSREPFADNLRFGIEPGDFATVTPATLTSADLMAMQAVARQIVIACWQLPEDRTEFTYGIGESGL